LLSESWTRSSVIADILADNAAEVFFVDRNEIVEDLAAAASVHLSAVPFCHGA
jgi:hypothetical protein